MYEYPTARRLAPGCRVSCAEPILRAAQAVPAVQTFVASAVADGDVAADIAEGGIAHHLRELQAHPAILRRGRRQAGFDTGYIAAGRGRHLQRLWLRRDDWRWRRGGRGLHAVGRLGTAV